MLSVYSRFQSLIFTVVLLVSGGVLLHAQDSKQQKQKDTGTQAVQGQQDSQDQEQDPLKRPLSKEQKEQGRKEKMGDYYKRWLNEDVRWIITDEEMSAFKKLSTNAERDQFIEQFWLRRDPTPDTEENEYKEEHYRRIAYANEHFAAGVPGWRTDRGRMYVMYGKPDSIDAHPAGGPYLRPAEEGGGSTSTYPFEVWRYRYLDGIGQEIEIEFVDTCGCGEYHMTIDRSEKDALAHVPNAGLTDMEAMGMANKADRFRGVEALGKGFFNSDASTQTKQFDRLETFAKLNRAPEIKFKDLEAVVNTKIRYNLLPFDVRVDYVKITTDTVLMPITVQVPNRELTFINKDGIQRGVINIFGRMTTLTGKVAQTFEDTLRLDVPAELLDKVVSNVALYWKALPVRPGHYRLDIVIKDVNGDKIGTFGQGIIVPEYSDDKLANSSLILADVLEQVPRTEVGTGNFVIGTSKVRPKVQPSNGKPASFKKDQKINLWMQVYNLTLDEKTKKPSATIEYQVVNATTNQPVVDFTEKTEQMGNIGDQLTLQKSLPLNALAPGVYQVTIKVNDLLSKQTVSPTAKFAVE
ncbi:MAG: GWxTD domain-containing protein [Candidatus Angelobacter sp. Gp1-AA117]|nr:MAG: GWxTD domain-containing protein [Candidatus Angelobacter sp. Gp1-AA117]